MKTEYPSRNRERLEERIMADDPKLMEILLSKERTILSRERTAIAIAQLALAITALGFVIVRFFSDAIGYGWFLPIGMGMILVSGYLFYHSIKYYKHLQKKLNHLHDSRGHLDRLYSKKLKSIMDEVV
ncbi:MAG: DUF202 domain-containing protein [Candidatus Altiarchaeota archaeon]|nr:DUF202 domain-containing protein [Candidatus Altiarchaeota archaeon]